MKISEIVEPTVNPTITPKSSEFAKSNTSNINPNMNKQLSAKDKAVSAIVSNHKKNMIDRKTAEKQLKGHGIIDNELSSYLDNPNS